MMKKTVRYYAVRFLFDFMLIYPFYTLLFKQRGQGESEIAWLLTIWSFSVIVFELPTGAISDRLKRRTVLLWAAAFKASAFLMWIPDGGFPLIAGGFILWGLSEALASGTEESWLFETLSETGDEKSYAKIKGRGMLCSGIAIALSAPLAGFAYRLGMDFILAASSAVMAVAGLFIIGFGNPPRITIENSEEACAGASGVLEAVKSPVIFPLILFSGLILISAGMLDEWDPLFLTELGSGPRILGLWISLRFIAESSGGALAHRFSALNRKPLLMLAAAAIASVPLALIGYFRNLLLLPLYAAFYFVYAGIGVLIETRIQHAMTGNRRATVLSVKSLAENVSGAVFILATGYIAKYRGFGTAWIASCIYTLICSLPLFIIFRKRRVHDSARFT